MPDELEELACPVTAASIASSDLMRAFSSSIADVVDELDDDAPPAPPPPPPPPTLALEVVEDVEVVDPDEEDPLPEDVLPDVALAAVALLLLSEPDAFALADVEAVVLLVASPAAANEVLDCICMIRGFDPKLRDTAARGQSA